MMKTFLSIKPTNSAKLDTFKWYAHRIVENTGLGGRLAVLMLIATILFYVTKLSPMQARLAQTQQASTHTSSPSIPSPQQRAIQNLQQYVANFPKQTERANQINAMMALAKESKLLLDEVTYRNKQAEASMLTQTMVEFSVLDTYPKIYQYLDTLLVSMPFVALDSLSFNRADATDDIVEARVRLIFYFGA